ncbi:MAG: hypothetical protein EOO29_23725, partial [Comamonadaceae bacterium]
MRSWIDGEGTGLGRRAGLKRWCATALMAGLCTAAQAQGVPPFAAPEAEAVATRQAAARLADSDTLLALTNDGAILYAQDTV